MICELRHIQVRERNRREQKEKEEEEEKRKVEDCQEEAVMIVKKYLEFS